MYFKLKLLKIIKTRGGGLWGQGGGWGQRSDGLETHMQEYFIGTRVVKIENPVTKEP